MNGRVIDLSVTSTDGVRATLQDAPPVYLGHECYAWDLAIRSHRGTYYETSSHVFRDGRDTITTPPDDLVLEGYGARVAPGEPCITAADLEEAAADLPPGCALIVDSGEDRDRYFSRDAAQWMAQRGVKLMGASTTLYDSGFENPTGFFVDLFEADIPIIANLTNVDALPVSGFTLIALPLKIAGIGTVPCRVIAVVEEG